MTAGMGVAEAVTLIITAAASEHGASLAAAGHTSGLGEDPGGAVGSGGPQLDPGTAAIPPGYALLEPPCARCSHPFYRHRIDTVRRWCEVGCGLPGSCGCKGYEAVKDGKDG